MAVVRIVLTVLGVLVGLIVLASVGGAIVIFGIWDRPARPSPVVLPARPQGGAEPAPGKALVVFHPGGSGFTRKVAMAVGEKLAARGYEVTVDTAHAGPVPDLSSYGVVCFGSPTYAAQPRPPLVRFIGRVTGLEDVAVGTFATAGGTDDQPIVRMRELVEQRGGKVRAAAVVPTFQEKTGALDDTVERFVSQLVGR